MGSKAASGKTSFKHLKSKDFLKYPEKVRTTHCRSSHPALAQHGFYRHTGGP